MLSYTTIVGFQVRILTCFFRFVKKTGQNVLIQSITSLKTTVWLFILGLQQSLKYKRLAYQSKQVKTFFVFKVSVIMSSYAKLVIVWLFPTINYFQNI